MGISKLVSQVLSGGGGGTVYSAPRALVVALPPLAGMADLWFESIFAGGRQKTVAVAAHTHLLA